jgi:hypothetical protein
LKNRQFPGWIAAVAAAAVCLAGCSGGTQNTVASGSASATSGGAASGGPTAAGASGSTPKVFGSVDTDPSDAPTVETSGFQTRSTSRVSAPWGNLPAGWNTAGWLAGIQAAAAADSAPKATPSATPFPGNVVELGINWSTTAVPSIGVEVSETASNVPTTVICEVHKFNPADAAAATQITAFFQACAAADFPGSKPSTAQAWITGQIADLLADLKTMPVPGNAQSPTPAFGTGLYDLLAYNAYNSRQETIHLQIGGATGS